MLVSSSIFIRGFITRDFSIVNGMEVTYFKTNRYLIDLFATVDPAICVVVCMAMILIGKNKICGLICLGIHSNNRMTLRAFRLFLKIIMTHFSCYDELHLKLLIYMYLSIFTTGDDVLGLFSVTLLNTIIFLFGTVLILIGYVIR